MIVMKSTNQGDIADLRTVLGGTGLFASEMLPDMLAGFLADQDNDEIWLTCEVNGKRTRFCFVNPEPLTDGAWKMLAITVLPDMQGQGYGKAITSCPEAEPRKRGQRLLIADTSGSDDFALTRRFYRNAGYTEEAKIRDFWAEGDDKVVFWKSLT